MASPAHKFGQLIGIFIEEAFYPKLQNFAKRKGLYLDRIGKRNARSGAKVTWKDNKGNSHDLDFVLEKDGTEEAKGNPVAFIEIAWRRYKKHSKNKAQEIQGAINPLVDTYSIYSPFKGAIISGVFTKNALEQLRTQGFSVIHFNYEQMISAFKEVNIDIYYEENAPRQKLIDKIRSLEILSEESKSIVFKKLIEINQYSRNLN